VSLSKRPKSRFGPPIVIEQEMRTGAVSYWQGDYFQSRADKNGVSLLNYIHAMFGLIRQKKSKTVLMIGCAGGSLATMLARTGCDVVAVDLNPQSFVLARRHFFLPDDVECRVADGFAFLRSTRRKFDAIVLDAFRGGEVASELLTEDFFAHAKKRLKKGGVVLANIHVKNDADASADRAAAQMAAAFAHVRILDRAGKKHRNATIMAGAVRGLKRPVLLMRPSIEAASLERVLASMQFRKPSPGEAEKKR
jgi:2-polyprenyl-3-methyl-5-hydroxy-6-metoxy-1,4-benzoquinol methylase